MPIFLFQFGFETPEQCRSNRRHGWDDEDTRAVFIECGAPEEATDWGCEIAERYVRELWEAEGLPARSWKEDRFAHWIETEPERIAEVQSRGVPCVAVGVYPLLP